ncbi:hypothetical protein KIN20_032357 [Parelaphostrongylus tenuis]|uniref:Uncharacterized protein n=1 Tax=Parelaphostrongylus tenuis TaxID=148309 RepID=A0AAD5R6W9_PARTN|nr:hypothetical protein KIN20_032357 [Parelaphostrongylus tenuis]
MPRLIDSRSWELLEDVPARFFRLTKEALSLRQKIVLARQCVKFLRRCIENRIVPNFIKRKRLHAICGVPEDSHRILEIELKVLCACLQIKQDNLYTMLKKCEAKEYYCDQYLEGNLWRRIVGGSKLVCESIRSNAKVTLRRKFDDLSSKSHNMTLRRHTDTANEEQASHSRASNAPRNSRVTVLGGITLPDGARSLLELGPSFSPSQPISKVSLRKVICGLHDLQDQLRKNARTEETNRNEQQVEVAPISPFPQPFFRQQDPNEEVDRKFRKFADDTFRALTHYRPRRFHSNLTELQRRGMKEV